ncbi:MAG: hypothetical protein L0H84_24370 [Pseudonocardia sp.]|nr:hypothetical protein [Pseudonocardia sp.]
MTPITVDPVILIYAFRYALGRMTYAVGDVAAALTAHAEQLRPEWRTQIIRDIDTAIEDGHAGMSCDVQQWRNVAHAMAPANTRPNR